VTGPPIRPGLALAVGILAVSFASILIRECGLPALTIAPWRLTLATLFFVSVGTARRVRWRALRGRDLVLAIGAGIFLALHFASWISSLSYTSVASSVVLVATNPLWVAVGARLFLGEPATRRTWTGLALAFAGSAVVGFASRDGGHPDGLFGDVLALAGAICGAAYILIGRRLRGKVDLVEYVSVVYGGAAFFLWAMALVAGAPLVGFTAREWGFLVAIAAVPQVIGHSILNWALRFLPSTQVALSILGEPVGASLLAWWLLGEPVGGAQALGCALILGGVGMSAAPGDIEPPRG
jgi:drug/metabolite transporter (DMT)-like permease